MFQQTKGGKWTAYELQLFYFMFVMLILEIHGCYTLNSEGLALLQFQAKVKVDPFGALASWNPDDSDPCMWSGVVCLDGRVVILNLSGRDLEGVLAPELGNLPHLRVLDLSKNHLSKTIPPQFGQLMALEVLDLRSNNLSGTVPAELGRLHSLRRLLLSSNKFEGNIPAEIGKLNLLFDFQFDGILSVVAADGMNSINRKFGHFSWKSVLKPTKKVDLPLHRSFTDYFNLHPKYKSRSDFSPKYGDDSCSNNADITGTMQDQVNNVRRMLVEQPANLDALPSDFDVGAPGLSETLGSLPSRSSGSFPAAPKKKNMSRDPASTPAPAPTLGQKNQYDDSANPRAINNPNDREASDDENSSLRLKLAMGILGAIFFLITAAALFFTFRRRAKAVGPRTVELNEQSEKAFVTGVPKLDRSELVTACEDFSNIVYIYEGVATLYKGTLSSGGEIAVASTAIDSISKWSKCADLVFQKEVENSSRVNHKNFINVIGYCEEEEPFTRMIVYEYAPNGTLFEHLHVKELEHLNWKTRMRIIMGVGYCLTYMHDLDPPVTHINVRSRDVYLAEDYAAKIAHVSFWIELVSASKNHTENESELLELPPPADKDANIRCFGIFLLETISGHSEGDILNWADPYLNDEEKIRELIDPALESLNDNQFDAVCEAIRCCTQKDPRQRPSMTEVIQILRQAIDISPEAASPRLSPLLWAEFEILST